MRRSAYWVGLNRPIVLFLLHTAIAQIGLYGITDVILNFYFVSLGYQSETIGILQGLGRLGGTITGIPLGLLADRIGARKVIIICMVGVAVSYVPLVFVPTLPMLILSDCGLISDGLGQRDWGFPPVAGGEVHAPFSDP